MPWLSKKTTIMVFTLDLLMRAFFERGELFVCHSSLCHRSRTPMIHLLLLLYAKNLAQFRVFPANPDKFPTASLFASQTGLSAPILHKFFACANVLLELYEPHFYSSPFLLQSSWHSVGGLLPSQLAPLPHFDHLLTRLVFQNEGRLQHFLGPFESFVPLKNHSSR